jgi:hypothetical protein
MLTDTVIAIAQGRTTRSRNRDICKVRAKLGRAIPQAVSRWLPTMAARVRFWTACGVCGGQSGTGAGFLQVLWFPLSVIILPISPSSYSPRAGTIGLFVAAVLSGLD